MKNTRHSSAILAGLIAILALGCATPLEVAFVGGDELSRYRTWSWARDSGDRVYAPEGDATALEANVDRQVEGWLAAKGFRRKSTGGDFVVSYRLAFARRSVVEYEPRASYVVSSHSSAPSYAVEGTTVVTRDYQAIHLAIGASDRPGTSVWRAELRQNGEDVFSLTVEQAVAKLLERFPMRQSSSVCEPDAESSEATNGAGCAPSQPRTPRPRPSSFRPETVS